VLVSVLQVLDDMLRKLDWLVAGDQVVAAFHDHISDNLLAVTEFLYKVTEQGREMELQVDKVLL